MCCTVLSCQANPRYDITGVAGRTWPFGIATSVLTVHHNKLGGLPYVKSDILSPWVARKWKVVLLFRAIGGKRETFSELTLRRRLSFYLGLAGTIACLKKQWFAKVEQKQILELHPMFWGTNYQVNINTFVCSTRVYSYDTAIVPLYEYSRRTAAHVLL